MSMLLCYNTCLCSYAITRDYAPMLKNYVHVLSNCVRTHVLSSYVIRYVLSSLSLYIAHASVRSKSAGAPCSGALA